MTNKTCYFFLQKQILLMLGLSLLPGLGYIFLGWLNNIILPAVIWYTLIALVCFWGYRIYSSFLYEAMSPSELDKWYKQLRWFFYISFSLWTLVFILYAGETNSKMHYIAIFTQLGASVVASALLYPDKKLYTPIIIILMVPLTIYFAGIQQWYGYVLCIFAYVFMGVLLYAANSSNKLLQKTWFQASHDQLTGLYNRNYFIDHLQQTLNHLSRKDHYSYLLLIDLDHFKTINDSLGHDIGDKLLIEVTRRMADLLNKNHTLARLGGDEFIITGPYYNNHKDCQHDALIFSNQLLETIKQPYSIADHHLYVSASIGVNLLTGKDTRASTFIKEADIAMYEVKASGRDGVILFNEAFSRKIEKHLEIERLLHFALEKNEILLNFQPQLNTENSIVGCEVLVRWNNKELGMVSPDEFIPIAEQTGIIIELGSYILEESLKTLHSWETSGIQLDQFSINISMRQILHHDFINDVKRICQIHLQKPMCSKIVFELTETIEADNIKKLVNIMHELKEFGISFSMDDFGTGYSSLSYITQLPIKELKIDRSFVSNLHENSQNKVMISSILSLAKTFDLKIVAEGVETSEQIDFLKEHKCDILQGFFYSKPVSLSDFEAMYFKQKPAPVSVPDKETGAEPD